MKTTLTLLFTCCIILSGLCQVTGWQAIVDKQDSLFNTNTEQKLDFFYDVIDQMVEGVYVEISTLPMANNKFKVIISANGDKSKFQPIKDIVAQAPPMERFEIQALRQADPNYPGIGSVNDLNLLVKYMYFEPLLLDGKLGMGFYIYRPLIDVDYPEIHDNGCIVIDHLIGEEFFAEHIHFWDFYYAEDATKDNALYPITQLREFVEFHINQ